MGSVFQAEATLKEWSDLGLTRQFEEKLFYQSPVLTEFLISVTGEISQTKQPDMKKENPSLRLMMSKPTVFDEWCKSTVHSPAASVVIMLHLRDPCLQLCE